MSEAIGHFHFLRPLWLLALLVLPLMLWRGLRHGATERELARWIDAPLRAHVLLAGRSSKRWLGSLWLASVWSIAVMALAGPAWRQQEVALYQVKAPLVVALDLSAHMAVDDLAPDRITRARYKLMTLLKERSGGQVALIVYSGDAFTVAPMTDDAATVVALIDALSPALMPVEGQRAGRALRRAAGLISGAGFGGGDVLLVTDEADTAARETAKKLHEGGIRVSVLAVGTAEGAALRDADGALIVDRAGVPQLARLDEPGLRALAAAGGGRYARLQADNSDLNQLGLLDPHGDNADSLAQDSARAQRWRDDGVWLLPLLLLLALPGFRRGGLMVWFVLMLLPAAPAQAVDWDALWHNREQRADAALRAGDVERARQLARDPQRAGAAAYRAGDWDAAVEAFAKVDSAEAQYNLGNALAQAGRLDEAIAAYDRALQQVPDMADAVENRKRVEQLKQRKQAQQAKQGDGNPSDQQQKQQGDSEAGERGDKSGQSDDSGNPSDHSKPDDGDTSGDKQSATDDGDGADKKAAQQRGQEPGRDKDEGDTPPVDAGGKDVDAAQQAKAQQALSDALSKALADKSAASGAEGQPASDKPAGGEQAAVAPLSPEQRQQREQRQAIEAALRRVPDDPGGLLRRKFVIEYQRREAEDEDR